ncbi:MAG: arginine--tRNA ligase [Alphaproteobacteria bacterium]|nr:arginine--tRNA ligase [Alphaproteobacteria bacterium]
MATLTQILTALAAEAFKAEGLDPAYGSVTTSDRPDLAQFQCNGALAAAKATKQNPRALAEKIAARLKADPRLAKVEIAGPGFINLTLTDEALAAHIDQLRDDPRAGVPLREHPQTVIIDFGGPNIAKTMHAGHLRSLVIGDALQRLHRFMGDHVISDVHFGDWGLQMGQLITELKREQPNLPYFEEENKGPYPNQSPVTMEDLERIYPKASAACKADPERLDEARKATAELQAGRPGYRALWEHFRGVSFEGVRREFDALDISFDWWKGESDVDKLVAPMVDDLKRRGLAVESQGALVIHIAEGSDKRELPPLIVQKSDGAALYETTDLATIVDRVKKADPGLILYVVGQPQHDHFEKVFRGARKAGLAGRATLEHIGFGTVNGPDGKPFRTRAGGTVKLFDLIEQAKQEARKALRELAIQRGENPPEERDLSPEALAEGEEIARQVGLAAIKFADLQNHRLTNYVFDLSRFTKFEGETGPYLQYAAVRCKSLQQRAAQMGHLPGAIARIESDADRGLALTIDRLPGAIDQAVAKRSPNVMCAYVFELAQAFSRFWAAHNIVNERDEELRGARLSLCALTQRALTRSLSLLGIEVPERM